MVEVMPRAAPDVQMAVLSYCKLCDVIDILLQFPKREDARKLQTKIKEHLDAFKLAYGTESWIPKFHYASHLAIMLWLHCILISCFVHERKHKAVKKIANNIDNTRCAWEKSIMQDVLHTQLESMNDANMLPKAAPSLCNPKTLSKRLRDIIADSLDVEPQTHMLLSIAAVYAPGMTCAQKDIVAMHIDGEWQMGEVWLHLNILGEHLTLVSFWSQLGNNRFRIQSDPMFVYISDIKATCVYQRIDDDTVFVVPPAHFAQ
jgi:hypothetical protein